MNHLRQLGTFRGTGQLFKEGQRLFEVQYEINYGEELIDVPTTGELQPGMKRITGSLWKEGDLPFMGLENQLCTLWLSDGKKLDLEVDAGGQIFPQSDFY